MDVSQPYLKERWYCIKRPTGVTDGADKSLPADKPSSGDDDVYLVAQDGTVFKANQKVLKVNSMYFRKILNQLKKNEVTVVLKETSARTLGLVLEYIEKGTVMLELSQVEAFVDSATSLQLKGIVSDFEDIVEEKEKHDESQESVLEEDQLSVLSTPRRHRGGRRRILSSTLSVSSHDSGKITVFIFLFFRTYVFQNFFP